MNCKLADQLARKWMFRYPAYADDIKSSAYLGAAKAADAIASGRYNIVDEEHQAKIENSWISGEIKMFIRDFVIKHCKQRPMIEDVPAKPPAELPDIQFEAQEDEAIVDLILKGYNFVEIAEKLNLSRSHVWRRRMEIGQQYGKSLGRSPSSRTQHRTDKRDDPETL